MRILQTVDHSFTFQKILRLPFGLQTPHFQDDAWQVFRMPVHLGNKFIALRVAINMPLKNVFAPPTDPGLDLSLVFSCCHPCH